MSKVSVTVALTKQPRPFESVRVEYTIHEVEVDTVDAALAEAVPVMERVFGVLRERANAAVKDLMR